MICLLFCYPSDLIPSLSLCTHHTTLLALLQISQECSNIRIFALAVSSIWNALSFGPSPPVQHLLICSSVIVSVRPSLTILLKSVILKSLSFPNHSSAFPQWHSSFSSLVYHLYSDSVYCLYPCTGREIQQRSGLFLYFVYC